MLRMASQAGQKCTLNKPLYCTKNGEHLTKNKLNVILNNLAVFEKRRFDYE